MSQTAMANSTDPLLAHEARKQYRLLKTGLIVMLALTCAYPLALNFPDPDLWGHVRYGQDWIAAGELPRTATHTYTAVGYPWVNHENAAELLLAYGFESIGVYGMLAAKCLLGLAIMATMAWTACRKGAPAVSTWALLMLVAVNLQQSFPMRPQILSFALCTAALVCLDRGFPHWPDSRQVRLAWLWALPIIIVAWVNSHGGFMAGLCIVGAVLLGRIIELSLHDGRRSLGRTIPLAIIGLACLAATLVNPYGLGMHQWLWNAWGGAPPEITEWAPLAVSDPGFWSFITLVAVAIGSLAGTRRRRDWTQIVVLALVVGQALLHMRHIAFAALLCGFWLPVHMQSAIMRLRPNREHPLPIILPARWFRLTLATAILVGIILQTTALARRLSDLSVCRREYPVDALQYMADNGLSGKAVVAFNWAQYAIAALAPDVTVGFDGRFDTCYPQEAIDIHFDFLLGDSGRRERNPDAGPIDGRRALEYGEPDLVLLERSFQNSRSIMQAEAAREQPEWSLLYSDAVAEIWGRSSRYDDPTSPHYLPPDKRRFDVKLQEARVQWPALPRRDVREEAVAPSSAGQLSEL